MRYSSWIEPLGYLKTDAAKALLNVAETREPLVITQNGETKAVLQDIASSEETGQMMALLKQLAVGNQDVEAGEINPARDIVERLRRKRFDGLP